MISIVNWQELVSELPNIPVYDDQYYKSLVANAEIYGTTSEELDILTDKLVLVCRPLSNLNLVQTVDSYVSCEIHFFNIKSCSNQLKR